MYKKMVSIIIILVLLCSFPLPVYAAYNKQIVTLDINNEPVTFYLSNSSKQNMVTTSANGQDYIIIYDTTTGDLTINGEKVNTEQTLPAVCSWVEYQRYEGILGVNIRDASVIAGAIIAMAGGPVSWASAVTIAGVVIARGLDNIYYTKISYYDDTLTGSRPSTKIVWHFYANSNRTEEIK
ncbi:hypothetical protein [Proteiniclasticum sp. QWL-01]|uniref:hypothetical protein n=1 Tax=Proteiniclasticum sp. QWL-01 TaxID=3036945 RepID=UPI00240F3A75|nr:hypothetical protein [Proteiniclasticum sp. QWL-01]WFF72533.1 hypothetical protein P6M73_14845 [Proteiniclasticum sp. QWL-01]